MAITYHAGRRIQGNTFEDSYWKLYDSAIVNMGSTLGNEGTGAWTHSVWHKADSTDSVTVYNKYDGAGGDIGFYLAGTQGGNGYYFYDLDYPTYHVELKSGVQPSVGNWDHIVITRSSSGVFKIYVNGVFPSHSNNTQTSTNSIDNSADWIFANHSAGDSNIADFTFWERELSASEVLSLYENGNDSISQTGLIHHYNFAQTGTSLTDQVGSINGTRSGGETGLTRTVQDYKPINVQVGSRYEETNTRKMYNYAEPSQNFASVLSTYAPQFFLKLDEGSGTALTNSGSNSGYTASITVNNSNPVWDAGVDGANKALKFTDNNNFAYIGHTNLPTETTGDNFTMGITFKVSTDFTGGDANHHHLWKWNNSGLGFWQMNMTNDGYIGSAYYNGGWQHSVGTTDASDNAWHTFFITCTSGSSLIGYLDGVQEYTGTMNRSGYAGNDVDWIGHNGGSGVISYDNVFFKNTVMTASEISSLHTLLVPPTTNQWQEIGT